MQRLAVYPAWSLAFAVWALAACATAGPTPTPQPSPTARQVESLDALLDQRFQSYLDGTRAYGALGMAAVQDWLDDDPPPFILDIRTQEESEATGHIAGAVRIPLQELAGRTELLPGFDTPIVTYCGGGWRCTMAVPVLVAMGWESVYTLKDGSLTGWKLQGYPVEPGAPPEPPELNAALPDPQVLEHMQAVLAALPEDDGAIKPKDLAQALAEGGELVLLDVRSLDEIQTKGYIHADAQQRIPIDALIAQRGSLPEDKSTRIVTYCGTGYRCLLAMMMLRAYGYTDVLNLVGGLEAWQAAGYPVARIGST